MERSMKAPSYSIREDLDQEEYELMRERRQIQERNYDQKYRNPMQKFREDNDLHIATSPIPIKNQSSIRTQQVQHLGGNLTAQQMKFINQYKNQLLAKIDQSRAENYEIFQRISDMQARNQQERRKSDFIQLQLEKITGVKYNRKFNQNKNSKPIVNPYGNNQQKGRPLSPIPQGNTNNYNTRQSKGQTSELQIRNQIEQLTKENALLRNKSQGKENIRGNPQFNQDIKAKVIQAQRKAQQYRIMAQRWRKAAEKNYQSNSYNNSEFTNLISETEKLIHQAQKIAREKQNQSYTEKRSIPLNTGSYEQSKVDPFTYPQPQRKRQNKKTNQSRKETEGFQSSKYIDRELQENKYRSKQPEPKQVPKVTKQITKPSSKLNVKSVKSSTYEVKNTQSKQTIPQATSPIQSPQQNNSKKNYQNILQQMKKVMG